MKLLAKKASSLVFLRKIKGEAFMTLKKITKNIQIKYNQFAKRYIKNFKKPIQKAVREIMFGILKGRKVQLNSIVQNFQNGDSLKKGATRLGNCLGKRNLWIELSYSLLETQKHYLRQVKFMILDLSDIQKKIC